MQSPRTILTLFYYISFVNRVSVREFILVLRVVDKDQYLMNITSYFNRWLWTTEIDWKEVDNFIENLITKVRVWCQSDRPNIGSRRCLIDTPEIGFLQGTNILLPHYYRWCGVFHSTSNLRGCIHFRGFFFTYLLSLKRTLKS